MRHVLIFVLIIIFSFNQGCKDAEPKSITTSKVGFKKEGELEIFKQGKSLAKLDIEIADSEYEFQTGLMYRKSMAVNRGMLFIFPQVDYHSFYMKNTEFGLDIIYIDEDLKVSSIQKNAKPLDESGLPSEEPVKYVLEVNAGLSDQWNLAKGDRIVYKKL